MEKVKKESGIFEKLVSWFVLIILLFAIIQSLRDELRYLHRKVKEAEEFAVTEIISFDSSAKILSNHAELNFPDRMFKVKTVAEIKEKQKLEFSLDVDFYGEKKREKIYVEDKLVSDKTFPKRSWIINIFERVRFYGKL